jgi:hypothetical protein
MQGFRDAEIEAAGPDDRRIRSVARRRFSESAPNPDNT